MFPNVVVESSVTSILNIDVIVLLLYQEKKAAELAPATNSIRWVIGANGTVVSFSQDLELPTIFSGPVR
jgi:hypothetical protein